ncbi:hypothetical protein ACG7TL_001644 [Trametes sanguinea]
MALALPAPPSMSQVTPPNRSASLRNRRPRSPSSSPAPAPAPTPSSSSSPSSSFSSSTLPTPASARRAPRPDCRVLLSTDLPCIDISAASLRVSDPSSSNSPAAACPLSPAESDASDVPLSPIVFQPNEDYEKARLSYFGGPSLPHPHPRPNPNPFSMAVPLPIHGSASSPSSPQRASPPSPVVFSHPNLSSPTLDFSLSSTSLLIPTPAPAPALSLSLGARLERPLPPLPQVVASPVSPHAHGRTTAETHTPGASRYSPALTPPGSSSSAHAGLASDTSGSSSISHCGATRPGDRSRRPQAGSTRAASPCSSLASYSDSDSASTAFSPPLSPSPSRASPCSSASPATSTYTTASSFSSTFPEGAKGGPRTADARSPTMPLPLPQTHTKPIHLALTIPSRSQSAPLPQTHMQTVGGNGTVAFVSPHISVTPASPAPHSYFPLQTPRWKKKTRTASATSIVLPSDDGFDDGGEDGYAYGHPGDRFGVMPADRSRSRCGERSQSPMFDCPPAAAAASLVRSPSPAPSLTPSLTASTRSQTKSPSPKSTLRRIASKTKLFGRRSRSSSDALADADADGGYGSRGGAGCSDEDDEATVVGHASLSLDGQTLRPTTTTTTALSTLVPARARSESPVSHLRPHKLSAESAPGDLPASTRAAAAAAGRRVEIAEVTLTARGEVWETRELEDVIPILRQLRAPARIRI